MTMDGRFDKGKILIVHIWGRKEELGNPILISEMLKGLVKAVQMTPHGDPFVKTYPTPELGFTATQPVAFEAVQHLHESYIVYDNWIELKPAYANIVINSCKDYDSIAATEFIMTFLDLERLRTEKPIYYDGVD